LEEKPNEGEKRKVIQNKIQLLCFF
jgi:hypothetical protein